MFCLVLKTKHWCGLSAFSLSSFYSALQKKILHLWPRGTSTDPLLTWAEFEATRLKAETARCEDEVSRVKYGEVGVLSGFHTMGFGDALSCTLVHRLPKCTHLQSPKFLLTVFTVTAHSLAFAEKRGKSALTVRHEQLRNRSHFWECRIIRMCSTLISGLMQRFPLDCSLFCSGWDPGAQEALLIKLAKSSFLGLCHHASAVVPLREGTCIWDKTEKGWDDRVRGEKRNCFRAYLDCGDS